MVSTQTASIAPVSAEADAEGGVTKSACSERTLNRPEKLELTGSLPWMA